MSATAVSEAAGTTTENLPSEVGYYGVETPTLYSALADQGALDHLDKGEAQWKALCGRDHDDAVTERLCAARGEIKSLADLQAALGLKFTNKLAGNGELGNPAFAVLSHSTSLTGRSVSPINPRAFIFTDPASTGPIREAPKADSNFIAMAFVRGEPIVELVARDRGTGALRFFLVRFDLACEAEQNCETFDVFGPSIEKDWRGVTVYDDSDLENTIFDCNVCHQPGGKSSPKMLRMIEQRPPWTHFFRSVEEGKGLVSDYYSAHDRKETYAGIPGALVGSSEPARLEGLVENEGFIVQPGELPTKDLARQVIAGKKTTSFEPYIALFNRAKAGEALPVPYPSSRFADPARLQAAAVAYKSTIAGSAEPSALPSLFDLHDEEARWRSGTRPAPESDGRSIVVQACARCHNDRLDPAMSRSRFDATRLDEMDAAERAIAIARMELPDSSPLKMPPPRFAKLDDRELAAARAALSAD